MARGRSALGIPPIAYATPENTARSEWHDLFGPVLRLVFESIDLWQARGSTLLREEDPRARRAGMVLTRSAGELHDLALEVLDPAPGSGERERALRLRGSLGSLAARWGAALAALELAHTAYDVPAGAETEMRRLLLRELGSLLSEADEALALVRRT